MTENLLFGYGHCRNLAVTWGKIERRRTSGNQQLLHSRLVGGE